MKRWLLFIFISTTVRFSSFSKEDMHTEIATIICDCLEQTETNPDKIANDTIYKTCIIKNIKPYKKEIKKIVKKSIKQGFDEDKGNQDALEEFSTQLDIALRKKCPDLSSAIIDSLNLFSEE